jgi:hypothetical protein
MDLFSTQFISYDDIRVEEIELIDDAWGLKSEFFDVMSFLDHVESVPDQSLTNKLMEMIMKQV